MTTAEPTDTGRKMKSPAAANTNTNAVSEKHKINTRVSQRSVPVLCGMP